MLSRVGVSTLLLLLLDVRGKPELRPPLKELGGPDPVDVTTDATAAAATSAAATKAAVCCAESVVLLRARKRSSGLTGARSERGGCPMEKRDKGGGL